MSINSKSSAVQPNPIQSFLITLTIMFAISGCALLVFFGMMCYVHFEPTPETDQTQPVNTQPASPYQKMTLVAMVHALSTQPVQNQPGSVPAPSEANRSFHVNPATDQPTTAERLPEAVVTNPAAEPPVGTSSSPCPQGCPEHVTGCDVKGNINESGEKIFHLPGEQYYDQTNVIADRGERWFCSAAEAEAAGWRPAERR